MFMVDTTCTHQIVLLQDEQVGEAPGDDVGRSPVHAADAEKRDLAEDGALPEGHDDCAAVDAAEHLNLTCNCLTASCD